MSSCLPPQLVKREHGIKQSRENSVLSRDGLIQRSPTPPPTTVEKEGARARRQSIPTNIMDACSATGLWPTADAMAAATAAKAVGHWRFAAIAAAAAFPRNRGTAGHAVKVQVHPYRRFSGCLRDARMGRALAPTWTLPCPPAPLSKFGSQTTYKK